MFGGFVRVDMIGVDIIGVDICWWNYVRWIVFAGLDFCYFDGFVLGGLVCWLICWGGFLVGGCFVG